MFDRKTLIQIKHIDRLSRQTRQYRLNLNRICDQKLHENVRNLIDRHERTFVRLTSEEKLEKQRKQVLRLTFQHHANESQQHPLTLTTHLTSPTQNSSCNLFSRNCQLYPCQSVYHYQSFLKPEHDQTFQQRKSSDETLPPISNSSYLQTIVADLKDKHYEHNRRQLTATIQNQSHRAHRHVHVQRTMNHLNEQSQLLRERLTDKKQFGYVKERQYELKQAIQRHLTIAARFYR